MSRYNGLDKISIDGMVFVESYRRVKIYTDEHGYIVVSRGFEVDSNLLTIEYARQVIDHFLSD